MRYEVIESRTEQGVWSVEHFDEDGECYKTNFYGPDSRSRAEEHAQLKAAPDARGWQDISTAPKDGTLVLVTQASSVYIAWWTSSAEFERSGTRPGWQIFECDDVWYSRAIDNPTHWMPLPPPPAPDPAPEDR